MKKNKILVYGAAGYTGRIICKRLNELKLNFAIAGREQKSISELSEELGVPYSVLETSEAEKWKLALKDVSCLINAAGPFSLTARDAIEACLANKVHYLDISAELETYQMTELFNDQACKAGIMLMPGAGLFVSYDALVVHTAKRITNPQILNVAFRHFGGFSKGSIKSSKNITALGLLIRENGKLVQGQDKSSKFFDFGEGDEECFPTPLGGVILSFKSTGIQNIREYFQLKLPESTNNLDALPDGPSLEERASGRNKLAVEIHGKNGDFVSSSADLPSGYDLTPLSVVAVANRVINCDFKIGFQSPGSAFGESIIYDIPGINIKDN